MVRAVLSGRDPGSDLALLTVEHHDLTPVRIETGKVRVGELVLALGRPVRAGFQASLGVVSALGGYRQTGAPSILEEAVITDATPYPGFSGGPLVNISGKMLGLNTAGLVRRRSVTIPADSALEIAGSLAKHGRVRRGHLGIRSQSVRISPARQAKLHREQDTGLLLVEVKPGGPADRSGLLVGDVLVAINGVPFENPEQLVASLYSRQPGDVVKIELLRGVTLVSLQVEIGKRPR
jgi:S1-C subfamily serine protease